MERLIQSKRDSRRLLYLINAEQGRVDEENSIESYREWLDEKKELAEEYLDP